MSSRTDWERLRNMTDDEIDYSDIPPLGDGFFANAGVWTPPFSPHAQVNLQIPDFERNSLEINLAKFPGEKTQNSGFGVWPIARRHEAAGLFPHNESETPMSVAKERLHDLIDLLPEAEEGKVLAFLEPLTKEEVRRRIMESIANAPEDDEPLSVEDLEAIREGREEAAKGLGMSTKELLRQLRG